MAKVNPLRFSTKYQDEETDLIYYGYRYLNANTGRWINRDPLASRSPDTLYASRVSAPSEDPDLAPILFALNSSLNYFDGIGLWPSKFHFMFDLPIKNVHFQANLRALPWRIPTLGGAELFVISQANDRVDTFQDPEDSYMHAMRAPKQDESVARRLANDFVRGRLAAAQRQLCHACGDIRSKYQALLNFGEALHTIQDYTSPAHHFQIWRGTFPLFESIDHLQAELYDPGPNSKLDKATAWLWTFFECEYGAPDLPEDFFRDLDWDRPR